MRKVQIVVLLTAMAIALAGCGRGGDAKETAPAQVQHKADCSCPIRSDCSCQKQDDGTVERRPDCSCANQTSCSCQK